MQSGDDSRVVNPDSGDSEAGAITTDSANDFLADAGNVVILGRDIDINGAISATSVFGNGGNVVLRARDDISFNGSFDFINTASFEVSATSADVEIDAEDTVDASISIMTTNEKVHRLARGTFSLVERTSTSAAW